jgi:hypothetical protein
MGVYLNKKLGIDNAPVGELYKMRIKLYTLDKLHSLKENIKLQHRSIYLYRPTFSAYFNLSD